MKIRQVLLFTLFFISTSAFSVPVGSGFSYQGELTDGGSPANGSYDIVIDAYKLASGGTVLASQTFTAITVNNGLINIPQVDFGDALYDGSEVWLEVSVRASGANPYIPLFPRQRMASVPYAVQAEFLANNGASFGDILYFDGFSWAAQAFNSLSKWLVSGTGNMRSNGLVGIKTDPSDTLHVVAPIGGENPFRVQVGAATKLRVSNSTGGVSIGANATPPTNGLYVSGDSRLNGNIKQTIGAYGAIKYLVEGTCDNNNSTISRSVNNVDSQAITISGGSNNGVCFIDFNTNLTNTYILANAKLTLSGAAPERIILCDKNQANNQQIKCEGFGLGSSRRETNFRLAIF